MGLISVVQKMLGSIFGSNKDPTYGYDVVTYSHRPDRPIRNLTKDGNIVASIYSRVSNDVAALKIEHVLLDEDGKYKETVKDGLNECLTLKANKDQISNEFIQDVVISMFDEGVVTIVPVEIDEQPNGSTDILALRTGKILGWTPNYVRLQVYNDITGEMAEINMPKSNVAIVTNPFFNVMNEPNSTLKRLSNKIALLDRLDSRIGSNKFDLLIKLPYALKSELRKKQAEERIKALESQLDNSSMGIGYVDGTEQVIQLNRPIENNLQDQIESLQNTLLSQMGISMKILDNTASEEEMNNYITNTVTTIADVICKAMTATFFTKNARTRGHAIRYFKDIFRYVTADNFAEMVDKLTRNEVASSNEIRSVIGWKPDKDPRSDELRNKNLNAPDESKSQLPNVQAEQAETKQKKPNTNQNGGRNGERV